MLPAASDTPSTEEGFGFDSQAAAYEARAGLPESNVREIAAAIDETTSLAGPLLEVGAGTGTIGCSLDTRPYVGIDLSLPMLRVFQTRDSGGGNCASSRRLVQADGQSLWPVHANAFAITFLSRAAHLFLSEHVLDEAERVTQPGGVLVIGRVGRTRESLRRAVRARMRELLRSAGIQGRSGSRRRDELVELAETRSMSHARVICSRWTRTERPIDSIEAWSRKPGLAGVDVPEDTKRRVLDELTRWAEQTYSSLDATHESPEHYELTVINYI